MKILCLAFLYVSLTVGFVSAAAEPLQTNDCPIGITSNAERYLCLTNKLDALNKELQLKIATTIKYLPNSGLWEFHGDISEVGFFERRAKSIEAANIQWMKFVDSECRVVAGIYEGGSGEETFETECRIEKAHERLNYLKSHEPYKSSLKNDG